MRRALAILALVLGVAAGCAGAPPPVVVDGRAVEIVGKRKDLPFDPHAARLAAALEQLAALAGHPIRIQIDAALLDDARWGVEDRVAESVENVARDLDRLRKAKPSAFAFATRNVRQIFSHHDPLAEGRPHAKLDAAGVLHVMTHAPARAIVPEGLVYRAAVDEHTQRVDAAFRAKRPEDVPANERAEYFAWLTDGSTDRARSNAPLATHPHASTIAAVLRLHALDEPGPRRRETTKWLLEQGWFFRDGYRDDPAAIRAMPDTAPWRQAELAYAQFLTRSAGGFDDGERMAVARLFWSGRGERPVEAFASFDRFAFGLATADAWIKAGHPTTWTDKGSVATLYEYVVCPHPKDARGARSTDPHCERGWYLDALSTPQGKKRLVDALVSRQDRDLVDAAFMTFRWQHSTTTFDVLHALEPSATVWKMASDLLLEDFLQNADKGTVLDEAAHAWRDLPDRRGYALAYLAESDRFNNRAVAWSDLHRRLGAKVEQADFAAFLDVRTLSLSRAWIVWPALTAGWSRADVLVPRLDRWLDDNLVRIDDYQYPARAVGEMIRLLCEEGARADLAKLGAFFAARQKSHPSESWTWVPERVTHCSAGPPARPHVPVVPTGPTRKGAPSPPPPPIGPPPPGKAPIKL